MTTIQDNPNSDTQNNLNSDAPISAATMAKKTTFILLPFFIIFIGVLAIVYQSTADKISIAEEQAKMKFINSILPKNFYDNNLSETMLELPANNAYNLNLQLLGINNKKAKSKIFFATKNQNLEFVVFEFAANDGYGSLPIRLVLATNLEGKIIGVRVVHHAETPGLADYIEIEKSVDKKKAWILQFNNLALNGDDKIWQVKKDGGNLWYKSGATVSARAISKAVKNAMLWFQQNQQTLLNIYQQKQNSQNSQKQTK